MSHEQDTVRRIFLTVYALAMRGTNPKKHGGVELINREMRVDRTEEHPFRPESKGYTTWFMVVPDDLTQPAYRYKDGKPVYHPRPYPIAIQTKDLVDSDLWRFQYSNWRAIPPTLTATGEVIDDPMKMYDDAPNLTQMWYVGQPLTGTSLTTEQKVQMMIPGEVRTGVAEAKTANDKLNAVLLLEFETQIAKDRITSPSEQLEDLYE